VRNILSALFVLATFTVSAQTGIIRGVVKTSDGYPAESVTIALKGTAKIGISDKTGRFEIRKIKPGAYVLAASYAGLDTKEINVNVASGVTTLPDITLNENSKELSEVTVYANRVRKESEYVAKMPLKYIENPQVYSVISSEILKQQAVTSYDDALKNVPGISRTWESTGRAYGDGASYFALRGLESQPTMYNGLPGLTSGNLDPADIERIEVIKGPTGTLFGSSLIAYGGLINTVTKKPYYDKFGGEVSYTAGSFDLNRVTADVNAPLSKTKNMAMRLNAAWHSEGSFQDAGFKKSFFFAPAFSFEVNDRLSFHFLTEILNEERAVPPIFFHTNRAEPMQFKTVEELNLNNKLSFTSNDLTIKNPRFNMQAQMLYKLSGNWTSQTVFSSGESKSDGFYSYIWPDVTGTNFFGEYISNQQGTVHTSDFQQNFNGDFKIGNVRNRVVIGIDAFTRSNIDNSSGQGLIRNVTPQGEENFIDPFTNEEFAPVYLTKASINQLLANSGGTNSNVSNSAYSVYASEVVNITPALLAMASVRVDYFDSKGEKSNDEDDYHQTAVSPKFGLVYQPVLDKLSLFANYMNGFVNVEPMQVADPDGSNPRIKSFRPEQANQWEVGVKTSLVADKLNATVSYYDIRVSNRVTGDPNNFHNYLQGGELESKGYELDLEATPTAGLNLIAGYSHNDSKVLKGDENDFYSTPGRSAGGQGPNDLVNLWATYRFTQGALKNFGLGFGGNHAGRYKVVDSKITGDFYLPEYTVLNASVFYNSDDFRVTLNLNNLANEKYYIGYWSVNPQKPRNIVASISYKF
jgi:iron complex outermembrane receptor protein